MALTGVLAMCSLSHGDEDDAGPDAVVTARDAELPECEARGRLEVLDFRLPVESGTYPGVVPLRALATADGGLAVLVFQNTSAGGGQGGVRRLLLFGPGGTPRSTVEVSRDDESNSATADLAAVGRELWVVGYERPNFGGLDLWLARIDPARDGVRRTTLRVETGESGRAVHGLALLADGSKADLFMIEDGDIVHHRVTGDGYSDALSLGAARVEIDARLSAERQGPITCLAVRERVPGRASLLRIEDGAITDQRVIVETGASFNPTVRVAGTECVAAFFEPDAHYPTRGAVRLTHSAGAVTGWEGTAPFGVALELDRDLLIATYDPEWPGQTALYAPMVAEERCRVDAPIVRFDSQPAPRLALGCLLSARSGEDTFVVLGGLTGPGEVALARWRHD